MQWSQVESVIALSGLFLKVMSLGASDILDDEYEHVEEEVKSSGGGMKLIRSHNKHRSVG